MSSREPGPAVPLVFATLLIVVASQVPELGGDAPAVLGVIPFYVRLVPRLLLTS